MSDDAIPVADLVKIRRGGEEHVLHLGEVTAAQAGALRQQSHGAWTVQRLLAVINEDGVGPEEVAGLLFLAQRQAGSDVSYDAIANGLTAGDVEVDFTESTPPPADINEALAQVDSPEA